MKKILYYIFGVITCITGIAGIYYMFNPSELESMGVLVALFFECMFSGVLFIMLEPRPRNTQRQIEHDNKVKSQGLVTIFLLCGCIVLLLFATSCKPTGYGCNGRSKIMTRVQ
jgi:hypothetical protein